MLKTLRIMGENREICEVCLKQIDDCICCPECSHICDLDYGEYYCPVCFPMKKTLDSKNDAFYMQFALKQAEEAYKQEEVPVGAILIIRDEIIASAYNTKELTSDPTAHAELTVIREGAMKHGMRYLTEATLYVTKEPCVMCAGAMVNARLGRLVYGCRDKRFGAINSRYQIASDPSLNHQVTVLSGVLEKECSEILQNFFKLHR